ncbi:MAG: folylpolyglutamate synthase/dihydrofolate synthase family protein [Methanobacteriota archaeon]
MDYKQAIDYLYALRRTGVKLRLSHIEHLLNLLGNPQEKFDSILVAGTNGKGSVCAMIQSVLSEVGYSTGLYTSPHLTEFTERIKVGTDEISQDDIVRHLIEIMPYIDSMRSDSQLGEPSFFEVVTAMAFTYFAEEKVDYAVVEVGLGGRLDATNTLKPKVSVITNAQMDHAEILGDSIKKIAQEKAGIIKKNTPLVTAETNPKALKVIKAACSKTSSPLYVIGKDVTFKKTGTTNQGQLFDLNGLRKYKDLINPFLGRHQLTNAATAVTALDILQTFGVSIPQEKVRSGIEKTVWPGRFEKIGGKPTIILDCAHNPKGAETLAETLTELYGRKKGVFALGISKYKDLDGIIEKIAPKMKACVTARSTHPQAADPEKLCEIISKHNITCTQAESVQDAIEKSRKLAGKDDYIVFSGSIFFIGDVKKKLGNG